MDRSYIECGKIINTHGCHGGVKAESWCNSPEDLAQLKRVFVLRQGEYQKHTVKKASIFKQFVLLDLSDVTDMDAAMALKNQILYAAREDFQLEEGEFFLADLIGLPVIDAQSGKNYGTVSDMINRGASDLYVVKTADGERLLPAVDEFIDHVDVATGVYVTPIEGLLD